MNDDFRDDPEYMRAYLGFSNEPDVEPPPYPHTKREHLEEQLKQWVRENYDDDPGMSRKVAQAINDINTTNRELAELLRECQRGEGTKDGTTPSDIQFSTGVMTEAAKALAEQLPKAKRRGRKSNEVKDKRIAKEYNDGLRDGKWKNQADYRRQRHPEKTNAWLCTVLKRADRNSFDDED